LVVPVSIEPPDKARSAAIHSAVVDTGSYASSSY
jgi:hypothetical protein